VDDEAFISLLSGVDPSTGAPLGRAFGESSVRGYDVTFSAPKSVSVLAAVADPATRAQVHAAHDAAVDAVLGYVQRHAPTRVRVEGEVVSVDAAGIAVGVFRQHVSREMDPQLHSHAVVAAKVPSPDGRWLALDARPLMADQTVLSGLYHAGLRSELTRRLGVGWEVPVNGIAEMTGVQGEVLEEFSQRASQVGARQEVKLDRFRETFRREPTGREQWRLEREAVVESRRAKPAAETAGDLRAAWTERLAVLGVDPDRLVAGMVGRTLEPSQTLDGEPWGPLGDAALATLTETRSTWRHPDVVRELARAVPTDTGLAAGDLVADLEHAAEVFAQEWLVELARPVPDGVALRASDGRPVSESPLERRYTTAYILEREQRLAHWAHARWCQSARAAILEPGGMDCAQHAAAQAVAGDAAIVWSLARPAPVRPPRFAPPSTRSPPRGARCSRWPQRRPPPGSLPRRPGW
jgi:conjugative relaxase-like TrwC/TraI family protein